MATTTKEKKTSKEPTYPIQFVPLDNLVDHEQLPNPRQLDKDHVQNLFESIQRVGLDTPIIAWPTEDATTEMVLPGSDKPVPATFMVAGWHRRAALKKFRKEDKAGFLKKFPDGKIPTKIVSGSLEDALCTQLRENLARENPSAEEVLPAVIRLKDEFGMNNTKIAKRVGRSNAWVSSVLSIRENLGEEAMEAVNKGEISISDAVKASDKVRKNEKGKVEALSEARAKTAKKKAKGKKRAESRFSLKALVARYRSLPGVKAVEALKLTEAIFAYCLEETDELPDLLTHEEEAAAEEKAPAKKKKVAAE